MGKNSAIEWTTHTWNPWVGCRKVSQGCKNCYMFRDQRRYGRDPQDIHRTSRSTFRKPLSWHEPAFVFTCSWSDFFLEEIPDRVRDEAWEIIRATPHLTYQILTKRPQNIRDMLPIDWWVDGPYSNVWLGVSVESEEHYGRIIPLEDIPAAMKFISAEPLLGPLPLLHTYFPTIGWVITGGESGPDARPADHEWFREIREQCLAWGVCYFHKQNGGTKRIRGHWGGRELDGRTWDQIPEAAG